MDAKQHTLEVKRATSSYFLKWHYNNYRASTEYELLAGGRDRPLPGIRWLKQVRVDYASERWRNFMCPHLVSHGQSVWNKVNPKIYLSRVEPAAGRGRAEKHENVTKRFEDRGWEMGKKHKVKRKMSQDSTAALPRWTAAGNKRCRNKDNYSV